MSILVSKREFSESIDLGEIYVSKKCFIEYNKDLFCCCRGEFVNSDLQVLVDCILTNNTSKIQNIKGSFFCLIYDVRSQLLYVCNDKSGQLLLFYSTKNDFSISDDFWSVIKHDNYCLEDLDPLHMKLQIFAGASPDHKLFFKALNLLPNAVMVTVDCVSLEIKITKYWEFKFSKKTMTKEEKMLAIDSAFNDFYAFVESHNAKGIDYGLGISGGMDSRIIPYYAKKHNLNIKGFIIGEEKPHKLFKSNDFISSEKIASYYDIPLQKVGYNSLSYEEQLKLDVKNCPCGSSQMFKIVDVDNLYFNVLLTGGSGFIPGSHPFDSYNKSEDIFCIIQNSQTNLFFKPKRYRIKKALNVVWPGLFNTNKIPIGDIKGVINKHETEQIEAIVKSYLRTLDSNSLLTERLMNYAISILGQRNYAGAFESLLGSCKSYTPYTTMFIDLVSDWSEDDLYDRKLFLEFIRDKLPELANIRGQDYLPKLKFIQTSLFSKVFNLMRFIALGAGVMNYNNWGKHRTYIQFLNNKLNNSVIANYIDVNVLINLFLKNRIDIAIINNVVKMNEILNEISNEEKKCHIEKE